MTLITYLLNFLVVVEEVGFYRRCLHKLLAAVSRILSSRRQVPDSEALGLGHAVTFLKFYIRFIVNE